MSRVFAAAFLALAVSTGSCASKETGTTPESTALPSGWSRAALPKHPRTAHAATLLADGRVMVTGGGGVGTQGCTNRVELYDPATDSWSEGPPAPTPRQIHASVRLKDNRVLLLGGWNCTVGGDYLKTADVFDPASGTWTRAGTASHDMPAPMPALLDDGRVISPTSFSAVLWDPATNAFAPAMGGGTHQFAGATATKLANGDVLFAGGGAAVEPHSMARLWKPGVEPPDEGLPPMLERRSFHRAILLDDGRALLVGGLVTHQAATRDPELFDPKTRTWQAAPAATESVRGRFLSLTRLADGRVLALATRAQIFTPSTNTWTTIAVPDVGTRLDNNTATLLPNGKVLVVGDQYAFLYTPP